MPARATAPLAALLLLAPLAAAQDSDPAPAGSMPPAAAAAPAADTPSGLSWGQVWGIIVGAACVGGAGYSGYYKGRRTVARVDPLPLPVEIKETYATKEELQKLQTRQESFEKSCASKEELQNLRQSLESFETETRSLIRSSEERSHSRMDIISSKLDRLIGLVEGMQSLNRP